MFHFYNPLKTSENPALIISNLNDKANMADESSR